MKKVTSFFLLFAIFASCNQSRGKTESPVQDTSAVQDTSLTYYHITNEVEYTELDYSKLTFEENEDLYSVSLPFIVTETAPEGEFFWLALYVPKDSKFHGWAIFNANNVFICRSYNYYYIGDESYMLQEQSWLTEQITQGEYTLRLDFKEKPINDVQVSVGYSTKEKFKEYAELLSQKELDSILSSNSTAEQWSEKGYEYIEQGESMRALKCFFHANKLQPDDFKISYGLGLCHYYNGNYKLAIDYGSEALALTADKDALENTYKLLGVTYYEVENYLKVDKYLSKASNMTPYLYYVLGISKYNLGQYQNAMLILNKIEKDDKLYANAQYYRALSLWKKGDKISGESTKDAAIILIERAAELGSEEAKEWLKTYYNLEVAPDTN